MADSLFTSLLNSIDRHSVGSIANALGEREQPVLRCIETSVTSVLAGLANKAGDTGALRRILDLIPGAGEANWSGMAGEAAKSNSPVLAEGKRAVSGLFGNSEGAITDWIGRECGLQSRTTSTLMAMAAPMVFGFLRNRMRRDGMSTGDLASALQRERPAIREALPAGLNDIISPTTTTTRAAASPVIAQAVRHEGSSSRWIPVAIVAGLALIGFLLLLGHRGRPTVAQLNPTTGTANRAVTETPPMAGTANREAAVIPNVDLKFKTGSAALSPNAQEELSNLASSLKANPDVHMTINGYTDNVGNADQNMRLAQARADTAMAQLVQDGVSPDRLTAHAYGEQNPVADNSSMQGRGQNRRVTIGQQ